MARAGAAPPEQRRRSVSSRSTSRAGHERLNSSHRKNGPPMIAVTMPTGSSSGAEHRARDEVAADQERGAEERRRRQHEPMVGADDQAHEVRHDDADERDRAGERYRGAGGQRGADERDALGAPTSTPRAAADFGAEAEQVEHARQRREPRRHASAIGTSARDDRRVAADVERSHQPAHAAERLGEVGEELHEAASTRREAARSA